MPIEIKETIISRENETPEQKLIRQQAEEIEALRGLIRANLRVKNASEEAGTKEFIREENLFGPQKSQG